MSITATTWDPSNKYLTIILSGSNLTSRQGEGAFWRSVRSTTSHSSGKWYYEWLATNLAALYTIIGVGTSGVSLSSYCGSNSSGWGYKIGAQRFHSGSGFAYGTSANNGDYIGVAVDIDNGTLEFYKNGVSQGVAYSSGVTGDLYAYVSHYEIATTGTVNFGASDYVYGPPTGYESWDSQQQIRHYTLTKIPILAPVLQKKNTDKGAYDSTFNYQWLKWLQAVDQSVNTVASNLGNITLTGDVTGSGNTLITTYLSDSGISAGEYTKVTFNTKGQAISGTTLANADLPNSGIGSGTYTKLTINTKGVATVGTTLASTDVPATNKELWIPAKDIHPRTTGGCAAIAQAELATNLENYLYLAFDQTTNEYAQFVISLPDNWNNGTVKARIYWTAATGTGAVIWGLQGVAFSDNNNMDTAFGTAQTVTDTLLTVQYNHISPTTAAITIGNTPAMGDLIYFQVYRDAAAGGDTLNADALLLGVKLQYTETTYAITAW